MAATAQRRSHQGPASRNDPALRQRQALQGMPRKSRADPLPVRTPTINVEAVLAEALQLHEQGNIQAAVERYARVLQQEPENPTALHYAGLSQYQSGSRRPPSN